MRTTISLDDDVAARLKALMRELGIPMKAALNATLRLGFETRATRSKRKPFRLTTFITGKTQPGVDFTNLSDLLERLEGPAHK